jgi:hypothetical protein
LVGRLKRLLKQLRALDDSSIVKAVTDSLGAKQDRVRLIPKKLQHKRRSKVSFGHAYFSDATRALSNALMTSDLTAAFRTGFVLPVEYRILAALWVNWIGHRYDACLGPHAYGSRLRRYRRIPANPVDRRPGKYHITALGSFQPYFVPYKNWREDGLKKVRSELEQDEAVIVLTLDLKSFYHNVDAKYVQLCEFDDPLVQAEWDLLSPSQQALGKALSTALVTGYRRIVTATRRHFGVAELPVGIPLGDCAARIIANSMLGRWDQIVAEKLTPLHYGRYVDDMFIVLRDDYTPNSDAATNEAKRAIFKRLQHACGDALRMEDSSGSSSSWSIHLDRKGTTPVQNNSKLLLQEDKCKCFILSGKAGLDLLDSVEKEIRDVASERRLLPDPDFLDQSPGAKVLTAAGSPGLEPDTFGRAEGLTVRRLGWSIQMRNAETLAKDLPASTWVEQRKRIYEFAKNHIQSPLSILDQFQSIGRVVGLAVSLMDWSEALSIIRHAQWALGELLQIHPRGRGSVQVELNGIAPITGIRAADEAQRSLNDTLQDAVLVSWPWQGSSPVEPSTTEAKQILEAVRLGDDWADDVKCIVEADLARDPYAEWHRRERVRQPNGVGERKLVAGKGLSNWVVSERSEDERAKYLREFLSETRRNRIGKRAAVESILPFVFATRPYRPDEIAVLAGTCVEAPAVSDPSVASGGRPGSAASVRETLVLDTPLAKWANYVRAVRGTWVTPTAVTSTRGVEPGVRRIRVGGDVSPAVRIALANLRTHDESWARAASGVPDTSKERYKLLSEVVNLVLRLRSSERPHYLVLPELALPEKWIESTSNRLLAGGVSLVAGVEYQSAGTDPKRGLPRVANKILLNLTDVRLGYLSSIRVWHQKSQPSQEEGETLYNVHGKAWHAGRDHDRVYDHNCFAFGILVCSELQNIQYQANLRGKVDALIVPSWNKDLKTFAPLVEAAGFNIHSYVIYANNGVYGDCRVRGPLKTDYMQDLCRLRGGLNPYVVVSEIDVQRLRKFQSRHETTNDWFKPTPDGFSIAEFRKDLPSA